MQALCRRSSVYEVVQLQINDDVLMAFKQCFVYVNFYVLVNGNGFEILCGALVVSI